MRPSAREYDEPEARAWWLKAAQALTEYRAIKSGAATWAMLGYALPDGQAPRVKVLEYLTVDSAVEKAIEERQKRKVK